MLFNSVEFALFLAFVLLVYPRLAHQRQNSFLLVASYIFYAFWNWKYVVLLFGTSVVDFAASHLIARAEGAARRRLWLVGALATNLGVLFTFKYYDFFAVEISRTLASVAGVHVEPTLLRLGLPVGISFLTFQEMGYTIDVYRREMAPARSLRDYLLFVSYFPHLVAGPIQRSAHLLRQLEQPRAPRVDQIHSGVILLLCGLFRKVVVADNLAPYIDAIFNKPDHNSGKSLLFATYLFAFQIYCDFAGYSEMAVGMSRLLGIELIYNFRSPYLASDFRDFWRRWHVSLSTWFRDYVFIPLGGSRLGLRRELLNLFLVFLVSGLWHGANWTFVVWGALHGGYLALQRVALRKRPTGSLGRFVSWFVTFNLVVVAWVFFRATSVTHAWVILRGFAHPGPLYWYPPLASGLIGLALMTAGEVAARGGPIDAWVVCRRPPLQLAICLTMVFALLLLGVRAGAQFIYFQF
jgi:alginate O-acetyltransferase complex protein AlgI